MAFVGSGRGEYVTETTYRFVGSGGNLSLVTPKTFLWGRAFCVFGTPLVLLLLLLLLWPQTTTSTSKHEIIFPTRVPLIPPPTKVPRPSLGECSFWGDPHIITFDGGRPSFYGAGEFWIVKSEQISIQGRFLGTPYTKGLAATNRISVGGSFIGGHVITVGCLDDGDILIDGRPELTTFPSTYRLQDDLGLISYNGDGRLVDDATKVWEKHILHMDLPGSVHVEVMRWQNYIDLRITMPRQLDQDGTCGNFNGDPSDDTTEAIMSRIGARVEHGHMLFHERADVVLTEAEEKLLQMCPQELYAKARRECPQELSSFRTRPSDSHSKACMLDICFGANEHTLRLAKSLGL